MKTLTFVWIFLLSVVTSAQQNIPLDSCYAWTRENYPNLIQTEIWEQISQLKRDNLKTAYLPQITLNGQATYQSDVTKVDIQVPGILIPNVSKDQYKAYAEFRQTIWDGGISAANAQLEDAILNSNLNQLEVEFYKLNEQVAQTFFTAQAIGKQKQVIEAQKKVLTEKLKAVKSAIENQMVEESAAWELQAEILNLDQSTFQLDAAQNAAAGVLAILTGKAINAEDRLIYTLSVPKSPEDLIRPETELFVAQRMQLEKQSDLLTKNRYPKVFGFGQAGYGRPGLNVLNDKFDTYYLVGVGVSWNAFDWKKTARQKQILQLQSEMIDSGEATFKQNLEVLLTQQQTQINKLEKLLEADEKMVELRAGIARNSSSKLENDGITTSDYIRDLQAETIARINSEIHRIQLDEAKEKYRLIQGKK